jgi:hypothetical protein
MKARIETPVSVLMTLLLFPGVVIVPAYSQTYDEWFAREWDSGCEDSKTGSGNQTEGKNTPFTKGYNLGFAECSTGNAMDDSVETGIQNDSNSMAQGTGVMPSVDSLQNTNASTTESSSRARI